MIDTDTLNQEIQGLQRKLQLSEACMRLETQKDFVQLFKLYYLGEYQTGLVQQLAYLDKDSLAYQACVNELNALSHLNKWLVQIKQQGAMAKDELTALYAIPQSEYDDE